MMLIIDICNLIIIRSRRHSKNFWCVWRVWSKVVLEIGCFVLQYCTI